jgi:DNA primase
VALYTHDTIQAVKDSVDIVEVVSAKTDLRRVGSQFQGLCPFHDERSPSFGVNPEKGVYYCFGCGAKGDAIRFVEETEGLDFVEAVELLGDRYRVELKRENEDPEAEQRRRQQERLMALLERVNRFYATFLWEAAEARKARGYLLGRGLTEEILREFGVGYSPSAWDRVTVAAQQDGYKPDELVAAGIAAHGRNNGGLYDKFRGRIMFPLADHRGRVRGFGARVMGEGRGPKYLNTAENAIFHKGRQLFGIDIARPHVAKSGRIVAVEGYTDVLALHQAGIREAVAIMGTSLTPDQLALLSKDARTIILALDADRAGQEAMVRAARAARDVDFLVVEMPEGSDPADLVAASGAEAFEARLAGAIDVQRFQVQRVLADADLDSTSGRDKALEEARVLIAGTQERSALRIELIREVADRLSVPESYATPGRADVARAAGPPPVPADVGDPGPEAPTLERSPGEMALRPERVYLAQCLASGDIGLAYLMKLTDQHLSTGLAARAKTHLADHFDDPLKGLSEDDPDVGRLVQAIVGDARETVPAGDPELHITFLSLDRERIDREIRRARADGDHAAQKALAREKFDLARQIESVSGQTA